MKVISSDEGDCWPLMKVISSDCVLELMKVMRLMASAEL
jgi:hypothetical protein